MSIYQFPGNLETSKAPYMIFSSYRWEVRGQKNKNITSVKLTDDSLILPISINGFTDSTSNEWEEGGGLGAGNLKEALGKTVLSNVKDATGDIGKYISADRGFLGNDYASLAFGGTAFRSFEFSFSLIPTNRKDARMAETIFKVFKKKSLQTIESWRIKYPHFWNIFIHLPGGELVSDIRNCVITNISKTILDETSNSTFIDNRLTKIDFSLSVTELTRQDSKDVVI